MKLNGGIVFALALAALAPARASTQTPPGLSRFKHVVFILKENHTFDNYFGAFPGADGASTGRIHTGESVDLDRPPDFIPRDIRHNSLNTLMAMDQGKMDRFDLIPGSFQEGQLINYTQYQQNQIPNYWALASRFVLADEFFTSVHGPSFPNHLFTIAAQSGGATDNPNSNVWGCDASPGTTVPIIQADGNLHRVPPCFDFATVADWLNSAGLTWRYYGVPQGAPGYQWSPFDAIRHIRSGPQWRTNVLPASQFVEDVSENNLATMTWVTTGPKISEHPSFGGSCDGENSTVTLVNAIMNSPAWNSTVIFISWDDFGGFYDHVPPPHLDAIGLGPRVPLLIVSPFVKSGFIEHQQLEFASVVKFIEEIFGLPFLTSRDAGSNDIFDAFDFINAPLAPMPLSIRACGN
jgi:phospholipase C